MTVEQCDLLDLNGLEFGRDVTIRWNSATEGDLIYPCSELLVHVKEPVSFILRFHSDRRTQQVSSDVCLLNRGDKVVRVVASGHRTWPAKK